MQKVTHCLPGNRSVIETTPLPMTKQDYVVKHSYHLAILLCILQTIALIYAARDGLQSFNVNEGFRWGLAAFFTATSAIAVVFKKSKYLLPTVLGFGAIIIFFLLIAVLLFLFALFPELLLKIIMTTQECNNVLLRKRFEYFMDSIIGCISCLVAAVLTSWPLMVNILAIHQMEAERKKINLSISTTSKNSPA